MNRVCKNGAFALLGAACFAAAVLLFLRTGQDASPPPPDTLTTAHAPDPSAQSSEKDLAVALGTPALVTSDWNTYHGDSSLRGVTDASFPDELTVLWRVLAGAPVLLPPVVLDGTVFAVTDRGTLLAISLEGVIRWKHDLSADESPDGKSSRIYVDAPISAFDAKLFVGTDGGKIVALNAESGAELWRAEVGGAVRGAPNYNPETGRLFVLNQEFGELICLDGATGALLWRSEGVDRSDGSPALDGDVAVFGSCASALHIVSTETGVRLRDVEIKNGGGQVADGVALSDGFIYAGTRDGRVMRVAIATGVFSWINAVSDDEVFSTPAIHGDRVIVTSFDGFIHALDRTTGDGVWKEDLVGMPSSAVIAGDKVIVAADGVLFLLRLDDGTRIWEQQIADAISGPAVMPGMIVVGSGDGVVTALGPPPTTKE